MENSNGANCISVVYLVGGLMLTVKAANAVYASGVYIFDKGIWGKI
jgi:hypothetical protein